MKTKSGLLSILFAIVLFIVYSIFILKPSSYKHFSLIDDGEAFALNYNNFSQCIVQNDCAGLINQTIEKQFGRFRPFRWVINASLYSMLGNSPSSYHLFKIYGVGMILILMLVYFLRKSFVKPFVILLSTAIFIVNFSFTETILRLGPDEPYQLLFLAGFSFCFFKLTEKSNKTIINIYIYILLSIIFLAIALFIKETSLAIVFALPLFFKLTKLKIREHRAIVLSSGIISLMVIVGIILARVGLKEAVYSDNYRITFMGIFTSLSWFLSTYFNSLKPFSIYLFFFLPLIVFSKSIRNIIIDNNFIYWSLVLIFFTLICLPWSYRLERYTLIPVFALTILIGIILSRSIDMFFNIIKENISLTPLTNTGLWILIILIGSNIFFFGQTLNIVKAFNYSSWYSNYLEFESSEVEAISKLNNEPIYINATESLDNWEIKFEIPIHLKYFYGQDGSNIKTLPEKIPQTGFIFNSVSLLPKLQKEITDNLKVYDYETYDILSIDPALFIKEFYLRPLQAIINYRSYSKTQTYYWEIRKLYK